MSSGLQYDFTDISGDTALQSICKKQNKLIQLLQTQINMYQGVIEDMQKDIVQFQKFVSTISSQFKVDYALQKDIKEGLDKFITQISIQTQKLTQNQTKKDQPRQIIKQVSVYIERQIEVIKEVQKPIIVQKIVQLQQPIIVERIVEMPCMICNRNQQHFIKT